MVVYDGFLFFNELDLLDIRLEELDPVVDKFILVESTHTFSGIQKPLHFENNKERYGKYLHKIIHIIVDDSPTREYVAGDARRAWVNEKYQRNQISRGLVDASSRDIFIMGDLDEIPRRSNIKTILDNFKLGKMYFLIFRTYYYYLNTYSLDWAATKICSVKKYKSQFKEVDDFRNYWMWGCGCIERIEDAGWHFGYLKTFNSLEESVKYKLQSFSHQEFNNDNDIKRTVTDIGKLVDCRSRQMKIVPIDESYPEYVKRNETMLREKGFIL